MERAFVPVHKASSLPEALKDTKFHMRSKFSSTLEMISGTPKAFHHESEEFPRLLVGPVIGKVTTTSARILLEIDRDELITLVLNEGLSYTHVVSSQGGLLRRLGTSLSMLSNSDGSMRSNFDKCSEVQKLMVGKRPSVFEFNNLVPGMKYSVEIHCDKGQIVNVVPSSFRTFPEGHGEALGLGVISCNKFFVTKKEVSSHSDLWYHLSKAIEARKVDLLVHLGDQIYGDGDPRHDVKVGRDRDKWSNRFRKSKEMLKNVSPEEWNCYADRICEEYRDVYRETWQHPPTAKCLANCPNLMIYDDHEIRDNWGDLEGDWLKDTVDFFIARCAWIVSLEYQRQLYDDVDLNDLQAIDKDYHFHKICGIGFIFLDIRGSRTFHRKMDDTTPYLGSKQWVDIRKSLDVGGLFDDVKMLSVCSPAPLVFLQEGITKTFADNVNKLEDFKGHWSVHPDEQLSMIDCLFHWKTSQENRDVLVLGGDVHCGGHSVICKPESTEILQLTSSAISNRPLPKSVYYTLRLAEQLGRLKSTYTFKHHQWTRSRNYGFVHIKNHRSQDIGKPSIMCQLICGKYVTGAKVKIKFSNHQTAPPEDSSHFPRPFTACCSCSTTE